MKKFLTLVIVFAFITLLAGCNDIKPNTTETTGDPIETSIPTETGEIEETVETDEPENNDIPLNPGDIDFKTIYMPEADAVRKFRYDDEHELIVTNNYVRDDAGDVTKYSDICIYMVDSQNGEIVGKHIIGDNENLIRLIRYNEDGSGCVLYSSEYDFKAGKYNILLAYEVNLVDGKMIATETDMEMHPICEAYVTSPDGKYVIMQTEEYVEAAIWGALYGGIDVKYPDGTVRRVLTNGERKEPNSGHRSYSNPFFIGDTRFVCEIHSGEWLIGYGIYTNLCG